jgi:ATP-dependent Zn protease
MKKRSAKEIEATAYHEAGHAVMGWFLDRRCLKATIMVDNERGSLGHVQHDRLKRFNPDVKDSPGLRDRIDREIMICLAGMQAEAKVRGKQNWTGASGDHDQAVYLASYRCGDGEETSAYLRWLTVRTRALVRNVLWKQIEGVALALKKSHTLNGEEVTAICLETIKHGRTAGKG